MVRTLSTMLSLGVEAPAFQLPEVAGGSVSLDDFKGKKALLVMFISKHCPFVRHVLSELTRLGKDYADSSLGIVAISSNEVENFPDDAPEQLAEMAQAAFKPGLWLLVLEPFRDLAKLRFSPGSHNDGRCESADDVGPEKD